MIELTTGAHFNNGKKYFQFANILDENVTQEEVFKRCDLKDMCASFINNAKNCNVIVYGPTNSGKTYTMQGDQKVLQTPQTSPKKKRQVKRP